MTKKDLFDIVVVPLTVCIVGLAGTYVITENQNKLSQTLAEKQQEQADALAETQYGLQKDQHVESKNMAITKEFYELFYDTKLCERKRFVEVFLSHASPERAGILSEEYRQNCHNEDKQLETKKVVDLAVENQILSYISDLQGAARGIARTRLVDLYRNYSDIANPIFAETLNKNMQEYRISLGLCNVLSRQNSWTPNRELEIQFRQLLTVSLNKDDPVFKDNCSQALKKMTSNN